jgi:predicted dienelactone hydrolase
LGCGGGIEDTAGTDPAVDPLAFAVDAPGPFNTGHKAWEITYDVLPGQSRTIPIHIWYPTEAETGDEVRYLDAFVDEVSLGNAEPAPSLYADGYPLHAYSHGHQAFAGNNQDTMRWFASHGWVTVAPDHVDNLITDNPDNEPAGFNTWRPLDIKAAIDAVAAGLEGFTDAVDPSRVLVSGHSRGASTVWTLAGAAADPAAADDYCAGCSADQLALFADGGLVESRMVAAMPTAGTLRTSWFGDTGHRSADHPFLAMTGTEDQVGQQDQWDVVDQIPFAWLELEGGCHETFGLGICATLDPVDGYWMVNTYAMAHGRVHVLGDTDATAVGLLDGTIELDPRAALQVK